MRTEQCFKDGQQRFALNRSAITTPGRRQRLLAGLAPTCCLLILAELRALPIFRRRVRYRGKLGILDLGCEYYLAIRTRPTAASPSHATKPGTREADGGMR